MKSFKNFIIFFVCTFIILLISYRLLDMNRFYSVELWGLSHQDISSIFVCDFNNLFIQPRLTDMVTSTSKLLYNYINPRITHRLIYISCLGLSIIFFAILLLRLKINFQLSLFAIIFLSFSPYFLSYFFEYKTTVTSIAWSGFLYLIITNLYFAIHKEKKFLAYFYSIIIPFILFNIGYEVFCISRPISIFIFGFLLIYFCIYFRQYLFPYLLGSILSIFVLKIMHPNVQANLSLFIARGEGISRELEKESFKTSWEIIKNRLSELHFLFHFPKYDQYISEMPINTACLDVFILLFICLVLFIFLFFKNKKKLKITIRENLFFYSFLLSISCVAFIIPLFSSTYIRGHRLATFYFTFFIFIIFSLNSFLNMFNKQALLFSKIIISMFTIYWAYFGVSTFLKYDFNQNTDVSGTLLLDSINKIQNDTKDIEKIRSLTICDDRNKHEPLFMPSWAGVLYITGLACKTEQKPFTFILDGPCNCPKEKGSICLTRENEKLITLQRF